MTLPWRAALAFTLVITTSFVTLQLFTASTTEEKEKKHFEDRFQDHYKIFALNLPTSLQFAEEEVPMDLIDTREKLDRELLVNTYWQSQTMLLVKRSHRWFPVIEPILKENGVPEDFKYLALIESGLTQTVSPAGATGFWQLMKSAAKERGLEVNNQVDERYHVEKSTQAACNYLKEAKEKFGSWTLAAASYNMGMAGVSKQLDRQVATNYYDLVLNEETSRYIYRILAAKLILSDHQAYGFVLRDMDLYPMLNYKEVTVTSTVDNLANFAFENGINYKALKYLNPWLRDNYLPNSSGKEYQIKIPLEPLSSELVYDKEQVANFTRSKKDSTEHEGDESIGE